MNFEEDLKFGEEQEKIVAEKLGKEFGCTFKKVSHIGNSYDFISEHGLKLEVKTDRKWKDTGNVAIEVCNGGCASGVNDKDSTTIAYMLYPEPDVYYCLKSKLLSKIKNYRVIYGGDERESGLKLLKLSEFKDIFNKI